MDVMTALVIIFCILLMFGAGAAAVWFTSRPHISGDMTIGVFFMVMVFIVMMFVLIMKVLPV